MKTASVLGIFVLVLGLVLADDRSRLETFYKSTNGPGWYRNTNWMNDSVDICSWWGVFCDSNRNVESLTLVNNLVTGPLSPDVFDGWTNLKSLLLDVNRISGAVPTTIATTSLGTLSLASNSVNESLPSELGNLQDLTMLSLSSNKIPGAIPSELGKLQKLNYFTGDMNYFSGQVPPELGNAVNLTYMSLTLNRLTGTLPPNLGNLKNLVYFLADANQLSGSIPTEFGNLINLSSLSLSQNSLTGSIPTEMGDIEYLSIFYASSDKFSGILPDWICNVKSFSFIGSTFSCPLPSCCSPSPYNSCGKCK